MKILICGAGTVGLYFGSRISNVGLEVCFLDLPHVKEKLGGQGIVIHPLSNKTYSFEPKIESKVSDIEPPDIILFCVKSYNTFEVAMEIVSLMQPNTTILSLQNGLENERILSRVLGEDAIVGAVLEFSGDLNDKDILQHAPAKIFFGEFQGKKTERIETLSELFSNSNIDNEPVENILQKIWFHFIWNSIFLPVSALSGLRLSEIYENKELMKVVEEMLEESLKVLEKDQPIVDKELLKDNFNKKKTLPIRTSMLKDLEREKKLELEELLGILIKRARKNNFSVSTCNIVYSFLKAIELKNRAV